MPTYSNVTPPLSVMPGDVGFSWNNEAFPSNGTSGQQFALTFPAGFPDSGRAIRWQTIFGTAPTAVNTVLQAAMADVDAEYQTIDTSTATTGEARTVTGVVGRFIRAKLTSATGGSGLTTKILA